MADCTSVVPDWTTVLSALLTPTIALLSACIVLLSAYIAYQQWRTNRNKLKLALFDRRFAVYDAARDLIWAVQVHAQPSYEQLLTFRVKTAGARFLLNDSIERYLTSELWEKAAQLDRLWSEMGGLVDEPRRQNDERRREIREWFDSQLTTLNDKFEEFLHVEH